MMRLNQRINKYRLLNYHLKNFTTLIPNAVAPNIESRSTKQKET